MPANDGVLNRRPSRVGREAVNVTTASVLEWNSPPNKLFRETEYRPVPGFKSIGEQRPASVIWQHCTEREKNGHCDLVFCRKRPAAELREQPRERGELRPLTGCDIEAELVLAEIKGSAGIHQFLARRKPPYDGAQMLHPSQKAIDVALKRAGIGHTPEA